MTVKILLLQARHQHDEAKIEERHSFAIAAGVPTENITPFDLLTAAPTLSKIRQFDALMIGGSGDFYVSKKDLPNLPQLLDVLQEVVAAGQPTFASCFGFQLMVQALDGNIIYDPEHMEVGTFPVTLTQAGQADELFADMPQTFRAQIGRKDRAEYLPEGFLHLASSENAPFQALRVPNKPIWATQFHPELTKEENLKRFRRYMDGYASMLLPGELQKTLERFDDSPEADGLLRRFMTLVFG